MLNMIACGQLKEVGPYPALTAKLRVRSAPYPARTMVNRIMPHSESVGIAPGWTAKATPLTKDRVGPAGAAQAALLQFASRENRTNVPVAVRAGVKNRERAGSPVWSPAVEVRVSAPELFGTTPVQVGTFVPQ